MIEKKYESFFSKGIVIGLSDVEPKKTLCLPSQKLKAKDPPKH